ncbi:hypothetical protein BC829DRAFT_63891 [Chytridium lagenaria]|nr:hypothetical protein BC829DRAFT_63891 [Chytridium lagenaria]
MFSTSRTCATWFSKNSAHPCKDTSKFFFGSNRVMAKALGETHEEEHKPGMMHVAKALVGEVGLLFSSLGLEEVKKEVAKHRTADFARGGGRAVRTVTLPEGPVRRVGEVLDEGDLDGETEDYVTLVGGESVLQPFPNNMETQLRDLGMPTLLKGVLYY